MIDKELLKILVCPVSKKPLRYDADRVLLVCDESGLGYPIRDGIPVLLADEAIQIDEKTVASDK